MKTRRAMRVPMLVPMMVVLLSLLLSPIARAQSPAEGGADKDGWEAVNGQMVQPGEGFKANGLVAGAYGFIWLAVAGFVLSVWLRGGAVEREVERLKRQIDARR